MSLSKQWLNFCESLIKREADFYCGCRKIIRDASFTFQGRFEKDLTMEDLGFTKSKTRMLVKNYINEESIATAIQLWERRKGQEKYGSVGFTTYNHLIKGNIEKKSKRASVMGPCIQSVVLTYCPTKGMHQTDIDIFYRTTEAFKKFPADLVFLRDDVLSQFDFKDVPIRDINFHFANVTAHPMYAAVLFSFMDDPVAWLDSLKKHDEYFYNWVVKWSARYFCKEFRHGIEKFSQAMRTRQGVLDNLEEKSIAELTRYLRKHHPGYKYGANKKRADWNQEEDEDGDV